MKPPAVYMRFLKRKIIHDPLPAEDIAAGWALGMFIGCVVPFGVQLIISIPLAIVTRVSKVGATLATFITNPLTIWFLYPAQCWIGSRVLGTPLDWSYLSTEVYERLSEVSLFSNEGLRLLADLGFRVVGGFLIGGFLFALVFTPITYFLVKHHVLRHRERRQQRQAAAM